MTTEEFLVYEKQWINNETTTMCYIEKLQEYKNYLVQQLANLNSIYEMQEIVISDQKKQTEELELRLSLSDSALDEYKQQVAHLESPKSCIDCRHVGSDYGNLVCWHDKERFAPVQYHFCCKYYESKDKQ